MFTTFLLLLPLLFALAAWAGARRAMKIARLAETPCAVEIPAETVPASPLPSSPEPPRQRPKKPTLSHTKSNLDALIAEHEAFMREFNRERRERYAEYRRQGLLPPLKPRKRREPEADRPQLPKTEPAKKQIPPMPAFRVPPKPVLTSSAPPVRPQPVAAAPTPSAISNTPSPSQTPNPSSILLPKPPPRTLTRLLAPLSKFLTLTRRILRPVFHFLPRLSATFFFRRRPPNSGPPAAQSPAPSLHSRAA